MGKLLEIPIYDVSIEEEDLGMTCVSFVSEPAIQRDFIAFSEEKKQLLWLSSNEKREVVSPILIPNQLIYRLSDDGEPYYIRWSEETIKKAAEKFLLNGFWGNVSFQHSWFDNQDGDYQDSFIKDVSLLRMWITESEDDEANTKYGFNDLPIGTLMVHYKVFNRKLWKAIKEGEVKGLSIEAFCSIEKIKQEKQDNNMKFDFKSGDISLLQRFVAFLNDVSNEAEGMAKQAVKDETESGEASLVYWLDDTHFLKVDGEGYVRDEEMHLVEEGTYKLSDGNVMMVGKDGKFIGTETVDDAVKEETEPVEAPVVTQSEENNEVKEEVNEETEAVVQEAEGEVNDIPVEPVAETDDQGTEENDGGAVEEGGETNPLVQMMIGETEVNIDQNVADYIISLRSEIEDLKKTLDNTPSVEPVGTVIKQNDDKIDEKDRLSSMISRLNNFKR